MPTGAPMPSCSSTTKSCGSTCRISRPVGSDTAFAASIARRTSSRVISRFFPATAMTPRLLKPLMCGPDSARCTESISTPAISSASSIAFLIDSTAASRLTTTPRRMPRDSATPSPTISRRSPSRISPTTAVTFEVPTSRPTRYRSLRATLPPGYRLKHITLPPSPARADAVSLRLISRFVPGSLGWSNVDAILEPYVDMINLNHSLAQRRRKLQITFEPLEKLTVTERNHGGGARENDLRVVHIPHVDL